MAFVMVTSSNDEWFAYLQVLLAKLDIRIYFAWCRLDQNIRSWLFSTLSESLLEEVHDLGTAQQVWDGLHNQFGDRSRVMYRDIKVELTWLKLEDQGVEKFLHILEDEEEAVDSNTLAIVVENLIEGVAKVAVDFTELVLVGDMPHNKFLGKLLCPWQLRLWLHIWWTWRLCGNCLWSWTTKPTLTFGKALR
ncbi:hypothetical protein CRG98_029917 [Punica granatum]|uniref:Retrotransposon gag domain-containing protein n=1 Tax=Punica granatum TaxID=22663 RepID=A0A2I0J0C3_PUNGR|nr:hypothetical protein CRG98_029917 [Punica granatum]